MRALVVAPYLPTPGSGGRTRLINFLDRLSRDHQLELVAFRARDQIDAQVPYQGRFLPPPEHRVRPQGIGGTLRFYAERFEALPAFVSWMREPAMMRAVADACERFRPDLVHFETTEMGQYMSATPVGVALTLDLQDVASRWFASRVSRSGQSAKQRALLRLELFKTRRYERRCARIPQAVFVTSPLEREYLRRLSGVDAVEVPNGVDTTSFAPMSEIEEEADRLLFVGPMTSDSNLDGIRWLARAVLPLMQTEIPGIHVDVVGERVQEPLPDAIVPRGFADDVRPWIARAPVSIVPLRVGSGTRYKVLEALAMGRAVVSTTVGAEGLGLRHEQHAVLVDNAHDFAAACVRLLRDPAMRARLGAAGRAHVLAHYDWEPLVARVSAAWEHAVRRVAIVHDET